MAARYSNITGRKLPEPTVEYVSPPREIREATKARREWLAAKLAELTAAGRTAKITGKGSYETISVKIERDVEMVDQVRGLCQACGGDHAIVGTTIAHHGYTRPGYGFQTASCIGARAVPLSESCAVTVEVREIVEREIARAVERLAVCESGSLSSITYTERKHIGRGKHEDVTVTVKNGEPRFAHRLGILITSLKSDIAHSRSTLTTLNERIAAWYRGEFAGTTKTVKVPR